MVPLFCAVHLAPPSVVLRIVPFAPTAHPTLGAGNATSYRFSRLPLFWGFQEVPPFVVARIVPPLPTTQPAVGGSAAEGRSSRRRTGEPDRKSTRLNSSHVRTSHAV